MNAILEQPMPVARSSRTESPLAVRSDVLTPDATSELLGDWRTLFDRDAESCALQHPDYVLAECRYLAPSRLEPVVLRCQRADYVAGAAVLIPKSISTSKAGGFGPGWTLTGYRLAGNRWLNVDDSTAVDDCLFTEALRSVRKRQADFLMIEDLDHASALWAHLQERLPAGWSLFAPNGYQARLRIQFPETGADYWQQFSKKALSAFRRQLKKSGETCWERITEPKQVPAFLDVAHQISLQTWQTRHLGLRICNNEAERAALSALARAGVLRSYLWYVQGEPAAFCVGNQAHGTFHYEEVGYATKFARFSPGQMLVVQIIEDLLAHDRAAWFDFGGGDAEYKRQFANHSSTSGTVWLTPPSFKARAALSWIQLCRSAQHKVRHLVKAVGLATRARQWIRYGGWKPPSASNADATPEIQHQEPAT